MSIVKHGHYTGLKRSPTYVVWMNMKSRCKNLNSTSAGRYMARGIEVCGRWDSFENFLADMGERPEGKTLDRIDNNGDYKPGNCRWSTVKEQNRNKRSTIRTTEGCLKDTAILHGVSYKLAHERVKRLGWSIEKAVNTPPRRKTNVA